MEIKILFLLINTLFLMPQVSFACSACYWGSPNDQANIAMRAGVLTLLFILMGVLGCFIKFFIDIRRKSRLST